MGIQTLQGKLASHQPPYNGVQIAIFDSSGNLLVGTSILKSESNWAIRSSIIGQYAADLYKYPVNSVLKVGYYVAAPQPVI